MALSIANNAEGGTDGASLVAGSGGNTGGGSGDYFSYVNVDGTSSTLTFSNNAAYKGSFGYAASVPTSGHADVGRNSFSSANHIRVRYYLYLTGYPSATVQHLQVVGSGSAIYLYLASTGKLSVLDAAGSTQHTFTNPIPLNTWVRIEYIAVQGTTTTNGTVMAAFYPGDSLTATESYTNGSFNAGTATIFTGVGIGKVSSAASWVGFYFDDIAIDDVNGTTFIGPSGTGIGETPTTLTTERFPGASGAAWPAQWTTSVAGGTVNQDGTGRGRLVSATGVSSWGNYAVLSNVAAQGDMDLTFDATFDSVTTDQYLIARLRATTPTTSGPSSDGYCVRFNPVSSVNGGTVEVFKLVGTVNTTLSGWMAGPTWANSTAVRFRFQTVGTTIQVKWWTPGSAEPASWNYSTTDSSTATGQLNFQTRSSLSTSNTATGYVSNIRLTNGASSGVNTDSGTVDAAGTGSATVSAYDLVSQVISATAAGFAGIVSSQSVNGTEAGTGAGSAFVTVISSDIGAAAGTGVGSAAISGTLIETITLAGSGGGTASVDIAQQNRVGVLSAFGQGSATILQALGGQAHWPVFSTLLNSPPTLATLMSTPPTVATITAGLGNAVLNSFNNAKAILQLLKDF